MKLYSSVITTPAYNDTKHAVPFMTLLPSWVWNLVADIEGGKEAEGVWEYGVEENIWT